jgi:hypothetical protein
MGRRCRLSYKITKLTVGKGKTIGDEKAGEWIKRYYEIEIVIQDEHETEIAKAAVEGLIDGWLTSMNQSTNTPKGDFANVAKPQPQTTATNNLPGTDLSKLPWKSYETKQAATENEAGWIFSNISGAEALLATLKAKDGKARIGNFDYQLQGKERQFISRKPVKKANA